MELPPRSHTDSFAGPPPARGIARVLLAADNVTVDYPGVRALDGVSLQFRAGEIHAVVGENGAGKSTLMKVISGSQWPTQGAVRLEGKPVLFGKPSDALKAGIAMVHQELNLVPTLSVAENVCLGREPAGLLGLRVDRAAQRARAKASGCDGSA